VGLRTGILTTFSKITMQNYNERSSTLNKFIERMPKKPYCTDLLTDGLQVRSLTTALSKKYIQYNPPHISQALIFDIDRDFAFDAATEGNVLQPSLIIQNSENGHAHLAYILKTPIAIHDHARFHPVRYAAAIQRGYTKRLGADKGYAGLITKNPLKHDTIDFNRMFSLSDLDGWLDFEDKAHDFTKKEIELGLGRNCLMFDRVRFEAYDKVSECCTEAQLHEFCLRRCREVNATFDSMLTESEPRATAKSVAKWTWKHREELKHRRTVRRGVMMLGMENMSLQQRQRAAAAYTNKIQSEATQAKIQAAYALALAIGKKPTQKLLAEHTGLSIRTVKTHWLRLQK